NFFLPVTKLVDKQRIGSQVKKTYDKPKTPFLRLLESPDVSQIIKQRLANTYANLDVVTLKNEIDALIDKLKPSPLC
ncbi:MAG: transposase, partial [Anaerolineae bacterium]